MKFKYALLFPVCLLVMIACGSGEEGFAPTVTAESAEWSVLVDGNLLSGDRMEIRETEERGAFLKAFNTDDTEGVAFFFGSTQPKVKSYVQGTDEFAASYFYPADTLHSQNGASMNITKYDADSLVANFTFNANSGTTPTKQLTDGVLKARLR